LIQENWPSDQLKLLLARSFFGIYAVVFTNFSLKYIEPSNSIVISHTNIIITAIMSRFFLREKLGFQHLIAKILIAKNRQTKFDNFDFLI
jgi:drug/metabolite transporter (DMT)-like permease